MDGAAGSEARGQNTQGLDRGSEGARTKTYGQEVGSEGSEAPGPKHATNSSKLFHKAAGAEGARLYVGLGGQPSAACEVESELRNKE